MFACGKEIKCIEIASPIIKKYKLIKVNDLKESFNPIKGFYSICKSLDLKDSLDIKMPLRSILMLLIFLLMVPIAFFGQIIYTSFFMKEKKKEIKQRIDEILRNSQINYNVSENKNFLQLWSDKGLRDCGLGYLERGPFSYEEKFYCLSQWIKILYDVDFDLENLEKEIIDRNQKIRMEFYRKNPKSHIDTADPIDLMPFEIDKIFGNYSVDTINSEFSSN